MNDSFLNSANAPYVAELYFKYSQDPKSIDESWKTFFSSLNEDELCIISDFGGPEWKKRDTRVIDDISFDKVVRSSASVDFNSFNARKCSTTRMLSSLLILVVSFPNVSALRENGKTTRNKNTPKTRAIIVSFQ